MSASREYEGARDLYEERTQNIWACSRDQASWVKRYKAGERARITEFFSDPPDEVTVTLDGQAACAVLAALAEAVSSRDMASPAMVAMMAIHAQIPGVDPDRDSCRVLESVEYVAKTLPERLAESDAYRLRCERAPALEAEAKSRDAERKRRVDEDTRQSEEAYRNRPRPSGVDYTPHQSVDARRNLPLGL